MSFCVRTFLLGFFVFLTALLVSHGDPDALGQLPGVTATADRYNRQLHEYEQERLTELKAGKTEEEQQRLDAAACYLIRCAAGIPKDDPNYATAAAMQQLGAGYQEQIELLREQVEERPNSYREPTALIDAPLFAYGGSDAWIDRNTQVGNFIRLHGAGMMIGGAGQVVGGGALAGGGCVGTAGTGCVLAAAGGGYLIYQGGDYAFSGSKTFLTGEYVTPMGEQVLQSFGLSPEMAAMVYAGTAVLAEGAVVSGIITSGSRQAATGAKVLEGFEPPILPDDVWAKNAPHQITPGTRQIEQDKFNIRTGELEKSIVQYDEYGRQVRRTDFTNHGYGNPSSVDFHSSPHIHTYEYGPGYGAKGKESRNNVIID